MRNNADSDTVPTLCITMSDWRARSNARAIDGSSSNRSRNVGSETNVGAEMNSALAPAIAAIRDVTL